MRPFLIKGDAATPASVTRTPAGLYPKMATPDGIVPEVGRIRAYPAAAPPAPLVMMEDALLSVRLNELDVAWPNPVNGIAASNIEAIPNLIRTQALLAVK